MKVLGIIVSAGKGRRFGGRIPKQFYKVGGVPVIGRTLATFDKASSVNEVCLVINPEYADPVKRIIKKYGIKKVSRIVEGGRERQYSVYNGLKASGEGWDIVVVHDGVRPLLTVKLLDRVISSAVRFGAAIPAVPPVDTLKVKTTHGYVKMTLDRSSIVAVQTPQAFRYDLLLSAHEKARNDGYLGTDDADLVERMGAKVRLVEGDYKNLKITTRYDILVAEAILRFGK